MCGSGLAKNHLSPLLLSSRVRLTKEKPLKTNRIVIAFSSGLRSRNVLLSNLAGFDCKLKHIFKERNLEKSWLTEFHFIVDTTVAPCQMPHTSEFLSLCNVIQTLTFLPSRTVLRGCGPGSRPLNLA